MTKILASALALACAAGLATAAAAETAPTRSVSLTKIDMNNTVAVNSLYARIKGAARAVCDSHSPLKEIAAKDAACYAQAVDQAVRQINAPTLTAVYMRSSNRLASN
jgi:UrcA family protein